MSQQRDQIYEDLAGIVRGDLLFDQLSRTLYSTDASLFRVEPLGVIVPRDEEDVRTVVRYAAEQHLPVICRGAGSGLAGESLGRGLVLDFSRYFRKILQTDETSVVVEPGVVLAELNRHLRRYGRRLAPDPASARQCTIGGMVANNASGPHALRHGYTRDYVRRLRIVFDDGTAAEVGREECHGVTDKDRKSRVVAALGRLFAAHPELPAAWSSQPRFNRCGYLLHDVYDGESVDLARLITGSEGTLAVTTAATLETIPLAAARAGILAGFATLEDALAAANGCLGASPSACEVLDRRLITLAGEAATEFLSFVPPTTQAIALIEFESDRGNGTGSVARSVSGQLSSSGRALWTRMATQPGEIDQWWRLRELGVRALYRIPGRAVPVPMLEDVAVPPQHLIEFVRRLQNLLRREETTAVFVIHAGAGQVHTRPFLDLSDPEQARRLESLVEQCYRLALDFGGTVSSQHGVGLARTGWVAQQYGRLYAVMQEVKRIFDPNNIFNPGKVVTTGSPAEWGPRRPAAGYRHQPLSQSRDWRLRWPLDMVATECHRCNGCGACRTEEPTQRMCPLFRVEHSEAAAPRAKANLLRALLNGSLAESHWTSDELRAVADLCINCQMCAIECPAAVQIPKLMLEAKAQHAAEHGLGRTDWILSRLERFAHLGSALAPLVNGLLRSRFGRIVLERLLGISRRRRLPRFAARNFLNRAIRRGWTRPTRRSRLAYFVDVYANFVDPSLAEATVAVLHHQGLEVYVPPGQVGCGMAPLAYGDVEAARLAAEENVRVFADLARAGYRIVCSEPTAALMLRQYYCDLVDDPDVSLIAERTVELSAFLWELREQSRLRRDLGPLPWRIGHHVPCHVKALRIDAAGPRLLSLIPQLRTDTIDLSCSGMAGTFGLAASNYVASLTAGWPMLDRLRQSDIGFGSSECSACRMQMDHAARKRSLHPVQYLAISYGLMPELEHRLREPITELVL